MVGRCARARAPAPALSMLGMGRSVGEGRQAGGGRETGTLQHPRPATPAKRPSLTPPILLPILPRRPSQSS